MLRNSLLVLAALAVVGAGLTPLPAAVGNDSDIFQPASATSAEPSVTGGPPKPKPKPKPKPAPPGLSAVGTWSLVINCGFDATETLTISSASAISVLGWTNNLLGKSQIVGGRFVGRSLVLNEIYGSNHKATWTGQISAGGDVVAGTIEGVDTRDHHCTFQGSRL